MQASAGSLKARDAVNKISASLKLEFSLLFSIHPLFSSHDRASFADEIGLGDARTCASRSAWGEKLRELLDDVVFWLRLALQEINQDPLLCFEESPLAFAPVKARARAEMRG